MARHGVWHSDGSVDSSVKCWVDLGSAPGGYWGLALMLKVICKLVHLSCLFLVKDFLTVNGQDKSSQFVISWEELGGKTWAKA